MGNCVSNDNVKADSAATNKPAAKPAAAADNKSVETKAVVVQAEESPAAVAKPAAEATAAVVAAQLSALSEADLNKLYTNARTYHSFDESFKLSDDDCKALYDVIKLAPQAFNCSAARFFFVKSSEQREKLFSTLMPGNIPQSRQASLNLIVATDYGFVKHLPQLSPAYDAKALFDANPGLVAPTAVLNSSLAVGYAILAARALGYDVGPMAGFDNAAMDKAFFDGTELKSVVVINIGKGTEAGLYPRAPRLGFTDACKIL